MWQPESWPARSRPGSGNKEAKATWIVAAIIIVYWFLSGFGVYAVWGAEWTILVPSTPSTMKAATTWVEA